MGDQTVRVPLLPQLHVPCVFERVIPGKSHTDGRRYLPLLLLRLASSRPQDDTVATHVTPEHLLLGVVDRHHMINQGLVGQTGVARLLFLLSTLRLQTPPYRQGLSPEPTASAQHAAIAPLALGQVLEVPTWEVEQGQLAYAQLHTELLLDIGVGTIGVRTNTTAEDLSAALGKTRFERGDWVVVDRSRVDILGFEA